MDFYMKKDIRKCGRFCIMFFFTGFLLFFIAQSGVFGYRWAFQLAGISSFTAGIYLTVRYLLKDYLVSVTGRTEYDLDLVVTEIQKNRKFAVCRIRVADISNVKIVGRGEKRRETAPKYTFDYRSEFLPDKYILIRAEDSGENILLKISYNKELYDFLIKIREKQI